MKSMPCDEVGVEHAQRAVEVAKVKAVVDLRAVDGEQRFFTPAAADVERRGEIAAGDSGQHLEHAHRVIGQVRHPLDVRAIEKGLAGARGRERERGWR